MPHNNDYILEMLYQLAKQHPHQLKSSYVVPNSEFKPLFPPLESKQFVAAVIPKLTK
jgi:hypothetical protein